jgi:hypothetical protein
MTYRVLSSDDAVTRQRLGCMFRFAPVVKSDGRVGQSVSVCGSPCLFSTLRLSPFIGECLWSEQPGHILPCFESSAHSAVWRYCGVQSAHVQPSAEAQARPAAPLGTTAALVRLHARVYWHGK